MYKFLLNSHTISFDNKKIVIGKNVANDRIKGFVCRICNRAFKTNRNMRIHITAKHNNNGIY